MKRFLSLLFGLLTFVSITASLFSTYKAISLSSDLWLRITLGCWAFYAGSSIIYIEIKCRRKN